MYHTYRVWMKDNYGMIVTAQTEEEARAQAKEVSELNIKGAAMTAREKREAVTVAKVEKLSE